MISDEEMEGKFGMSISEELKRFFGILDNKQSVQFHQENAKSTENILPEQQKPENKEPEIHTIDDAKAFFFANECADVTRRTEQYSPALLEEFRKYADSAQKRAWSDEYCLARLQRIIDGDTAHWRKILSEVIRLRCYWGTDTENGYMPQFLQAWDAIFANDENAVHYIESTTKWLQIADYRYDALFDWMERVEAQLHEKRGEEYARASYGSSLYGFKEAIRELRGARLENLPDNEQDFHFVRMPQEMVDAVLAYHNTECSGDAQAIREAFAGFHFGFCVRNAEFFLTGASSAADSYSHRSWDHYHFTVVSADFTRVVNLECTREQETGRFMPEKCPDWLDAQAVSRAVTLYRNRPACKAFGQELAPLNPAQLCEDGRTALYARIPTVYDRFRARLEGNPMAEELSEFLDFCEEYAPECGEVEFNEPAAPEEIAAWEENHGVTLPDDYKAFLRFSNGASIPMGNAEICGLSGIFNERIDENLEEGYHYIGDVIGDGAMIVLRTEDGELCEDDHGEISEFGGMAGLLEWIMEMV